MIIDSHTHIGKMLNFNMPEDMLIEAMDATGIDFSITMNVQSTEVGHHQEMLPQSEQVSQLKSAQHLIKVVRKYENRLGAAIWCKPLLEQLDEPLKQLIVENRDVIYALKFHPYHSKVAFNDERMIPYIEFAREQKLPIVTHTAGDIYSDPMHVYEMAKKYPDIKFVLVHLGLGTDNEDAIKYISMCDNLYGDSTWVKPEMVLKALRICGSHKIMFGTDAPINGVTTYDDDMFYNYYFNEFKNEVSKEDYEAFMCQTAKHVFNIK